MESILDLAAHLFSVATQLSELCHCNTKAAIDDIQKKGHGLVPIKLCALKKVAVCQGLD